MQTVTDLKRLRKRLLPPAGEHLGQRRMIEYVSESEYLIADGFAIWRLPAADPVFESRHAWPQLPEARGQCLRYSYEPAGGRVVIEVSPAPDHTVSRCMCPSETDWRELLMTPFTHAANPHDARLLTAPAGALVMLDTRLLAIVEPDAELVDWHYAYRQDSTPHIIQVTRLELDGSADFSAPLAALMPLVEFRVGATAEALLELATHIESAEAQPA